VLLANVNIDCKSVFNDKRTSLSLGAIKFTIGNCFILQAPVVTIESISIVSGFVEGASLCFYLLGVN
jgi:hypothetical protein